VEKKVTSVNLSADNLKHYLRGDFMEKQEKKEITAPTLKQLDEMRHWI